MAHLVCLDVFMRYNLVHSRLATVLLRNVTLTLFGASGELCSMIVAFPGFFYSYIIITMLKKVREKAVTS